MLDRRNWSADPPNRSVETHIKNPRHEGICHVRRHRKIRPPLQDSSTKSFTMVHHHSKENHNGADGLLRVPPESHHPPSSRPRSASSRFPLPLRASIPRLFSRSIDTASLAPPPLRLPPSHPVNNDPKPQHPPPTSSLSSSLGRSTRSSGDSSHPSDCRHPSVDERSAAASCATSTTSGGPLIVHPSTLSLDDDDDDDRSSRNPSHRSIGTPPGRDESVTASSPLTQRLYPSSRINITQATVVTNNNIMSRPAATAERHNDDQPEDDIMNSHDNDPPPRRSIRHVTHSWDQDIPQFPISEIQRMKHKTQQLRTNRHAPDHHHHHHHHNTNDTIPPPPPPRNGQSVRSASSWQHRTDATSNDSGSDVWGSIPFGSQPSGRRRPESVKDDRHGGLAVLSSAAVQAEHFLRQDFQKSRKVTDRDPHSNTTKQHHHHHPVNTSSETEHSHTSSQNNNSSNDASTTEPNLMLHDLCGEAVSTDDIAWRNALSLLAARPELASIVDPTQIWTPLHICCLGMTPPPTYMVRALLYVYPKATYLPDDGGRLALHLVAASSANVEILQMIVQENPAALYHRDDHGLTPLHLYIRNRSVELTLAHVKILLGMTLMDPTIRGDSKKRHVRQRRGDHLRMSVQSVDQWLLQQKCRPLTNLHHNSMIHEQSFDSFPTDVQVSLRQLSQWKHSNNHANTSMEEMESVEIQLTDRRNENTEGGDDDNDNDDSLIHTTKPAAIPLPNATQYPIHMMVQRMIIEEAFVPGPLLPATTNYDNRCGTPLPPSERTKNPSIESTDEDEEDDEEEMNLSYELSRPNQTSSILRLFAASYPEALILRDKNGCTPLLQVMQIRDSFPSVDIVEILIGKRNASGFEALPSWAHNLPTHMMIMSQGSTAMSSDQRRYLNPAMMAVSETGQLPLHIAAEEAPTDSILIQTIYECYPAAVLVQDGRGRTPLHLSFHNYRRITPDPKVIETLYTDRVATIVDDYGKIPFDLLVEHAQLLSWHKPPASSSSVYRKLFSASILGAGHATSSSSSPQVQSYLPRLRALPSWLRVEACATTLVQDLIVEELVSPWKCAFILLDGVLLITLISVFRLQMKEFIDQLYDDNLIAAWYTYVVYATAVGRLMARILFGYFTTTIGEFRSLCLFNLWYWIDVWAMLMSIVTSIFLYGNTSDERLLALGTATTILLWSSFVGYLSSWWYNMAIFTGGFLKVRR